MTDEGCCITCSDLALPVTILELLEDDLAVVDAGAGRRETVSVALVPAGDDLQCLACGEVCGHATRSEQLDLRLRARKRIEFTYDPQMADDVTADGRHRIAPASPPANPYWETIPLSDDVTYGNRLTRSLLSYFPMASGSDEWMLDLGCGEGGDSIWLAKQGWSVTGVEISELALSRAAAAANAEGCADRIRWVSADLATWVPDGTYDLVSACFFQSPITLSRHDILLRLAASIAPGGHLLVVAHASVPSWAAHRHEGDGPDLLEAVEEAAALALPADSWTLEIVEDRPRAVTGPDGQSATILDSVVLARRVG